MEHIRLADITSKSDQRALKKVADLEAQSRAAEMEVASAREQQTRALQEANVACLEVQAA